MNDMTKNAILKKYETALASKGHSNPRAGALQMYESVSGVLIDMRSYSEVLLGDDLPTDQEIEEELQEFGIDENDLEGVDPIIRRSVLRDIKKGK